MSDLPEPEAGLSSLNAALRLLALMVEETGPITLSELARKAGMPASKAHRYLASFAGAGLVAQASKSGKYDLGPQALRMGLAAVARHSFVNATADRLPDLCAETGLTALLSVWGSAGPTVVRWERGAVDVITSLGLGSAFPLMGSATGRVFLAWAPEAVTRDLLAAERAETGRDPAPLIAETRAQGYADVAGDLIPGLAAMAAPVLDWQGEIQAGVTLIGTDRSRIGAGTPALAALLDFCAALSLDRAP
ncbi:helix-turn-helix domain-containing protein [Aquicoccus sp. SCR17]|nr:helix-turn-helix domain-containing protein [Carideicomes alvinocaridis]